MSEITIDTGYIYFRGVRYKMYIRNLQLEMNAGQERITLDIFGIKDSEGWL